MTPETLLTLVAAAALILAAVPAAMFLANLPLFRRLPPPPMLGNAQPTVSVLIPARNEERSIEASVRSALASRGVELDVVVLDDASADKTADIVARLAAEDPRVRLVKAPPLPAGWCGKQHACHVLAGEAKYPFLAFLDADTRLEPDTLLRMVAGINERGTDLLSGFPRQETGTLLESLVIPTMHVILLGYLPLWQMRATTHPAFAAGCGQLFLARRSSYQRAGGHEAIKATLHDGIMLPRAFREKGLKTDIFDATDAATCRMYRSAEELWHGLFKNAGEGLGEPRTIGPATLLLLGGQVLPALLLPFIPLLPPTAAGLAAAAALASYVPRVFGAELFRQSAVGAILNPLGVAVLLAIQWSALAATLSGKPVHWKGREYAAPKA
jgi:hypothetical protein